MTDKPPLLSRLEVRASELRRFPEGVSRIMPAEDVDWSPHGMAALFEEAQRRIEVLEAEADRASAAQQPPRKRAKGRR